MKRKSSQEIQNLIVIISICIYIAQFQKFETRIARQSVQSVWRNERERDHERFMIKDYKFIFDLKNEDKKEEKLKFRKNYHVVYIISR
jgi:hypothetical protein